MRATGERDGRPVLIELELSPSRSTVFVNKQRLARNRDLLGALRVTVFAPEDLAIVKDGPSTRRELIDELMVALDPRNDVVLADYARVVRQRNVLLKQAKGSLDDELEMTLDVYDGQLSTLGERMTYLREHILEVLMPRVGEAYAMLAGGSGEIIANYRRSWDADVDGRRSRIGSGW